MDKPLPSRRKLLVALVALAPTAGCYGSFGLTRSLYGWNGTISNKIARELVFLALIIIPVYEIVVFIDTFLLNLIEFITGTRVVASQELEGGRRVALEKLPDQQTTRVTLTEPDRLTRVFYVRHTEEGSFTLLDEQQTALAATELTGSGSLLLLDGQGAIVTHVSPQALGRIERSLADRPLTALVAEALSDPATSRQLAALRAAPRL